MLEGNTNKTWWNWKNSIGPLKDRPGFPGVWEYQQTNGLGLVEYFEWAEDMNLQIGEDQTHSVSITPPTTNPSLPSRRSLGRPRPQRRHNPTLPPPTLHRQRPRRTRIHPRPRHLDLGFPPRLPRPPIALCPLRRRNRQRRLARRQRNRLDLVQRRPFPALPRRNQRSVSRSPNHCECGEFGSGQGQGCAWTEYYGWAAFSCRYVRLASSSHLPPPLF